MAILNCSVAPKGKINVCRLDPVVMLYWHFVFARPVGVMWVFWIRNNSNRQVIHWLAFTLDVCQQSRKKHPHFLRLLSCLLHSWKVVVGGAFYVSKCLFTASAVVLNASMIYVTFFILFQPNSFTSTAEHDAYFLFLSFFLYICGIVPYLSDSARSCVCVWTAVLLWCDSFCFRCVVCQKSCFYMYLL